MSKSGPNMILSIVPLILCACVAGTVTAVAAPPASALAYSPEGTVLAVSTRASITLHPQSPASLQVQCPFPRVAAIMFADNRRLAVGGGVPGEAGAIAVIDLDRNTLVHSFESGADLVTSLSFSPDGELLAAANSDHVSRIYRLDGGESPAEDFRLEGHSGPVTAIAFSPDGSLIVTASADRSLKVWSREGNLIRSFSHHTDRVHALAFRPRFSAAQPALHQCASAGDDQTVRIWQPAIGRMVRIIRGHQGPIFALTYGPGGQELFTAGAEGVIRRVDADSDQIFEQWPAHSDWIYSLAISPDGSTLASGDWSGQVKLWTLKTSPASVD